jgi:hypothetical protein
MWGLRRGFATECPPHYIEQPYSPARDIRIAKNTEYWNVEIRRRSTQCLTCADGAVRPDIQRVKCRRLDPVPSSDERVLTLILRVVARRRLFRIGLPGLMVVKGREERRVVLQVLSPGKGCRWTRRYWFFFFFLFLFSFFHFFPLF